MADPNAVTCPNCSQPIVAGTPACTGCGMRLLGPKAGQLWDIHVQIGRLQEESQRLIAELLRPEPAPLPDLPAPAEPARPAMAPVAAGGPGTASPGTRPPKPGRNPITGQRLLLGLGALLLLSAVVVFLVVVWSYVGLVGQALIMAGLTVAAAAAARLATARKLPAAAETAAVIATALLVIDLTFAHRRNLWGLGDLALDRYWAGAALLAGALLLGFDALVGRGSAEAPLRRVLTYRPTAGAMFAAAPWFTYWGLDLGNGVTRVVALAMVALASGGVALAAIRWDEPMPVGGDGSDSTVRRVVVSAVPGAVSGALALVAHLSAGVQWGCNSANPLGSRYLVFLLLLVGPLCLGSAAFIRRVEDTRHKVVLLAALVWSAPALLIPLSVGYDPASTSAERYGAFVLALVGPLALVIVSGLSRWRADATKVLAMGIVAGLPALGVPMSVGIDGTYPVVPRWVALTALVVAPVLLGLLSTPAGARWYPPDLRAKLVVGALLWMGAATLVALSLGYDYSLVAGDRYLAFGVALLLPLLLAALAGSSRWTGQTDALLVLASVLAIAALGIAINFGYQLDATAAERYLACGALFLAPLVLAGLGSGRVLGLYASPASRHRVLVAALVWSAPAWGIPASDTPYPVWIALAGVAAVLATRFHLRGIPTPPLRDWTLQQGVASAVLVAQPVLLLVTWLITEQHRWTLWDLATDRDRDAAAPALVAALPALFWAVSSAVGAYRRRLVAWGFVAEVALLLSVLIGLDGVTTTTWWVVALVLTIAQAGLAVVSARRSGGATRRGPRPTEQTLAAADAGTTLDDLIHTRFWAGVDLLALGFATFYGLRALLAAVPLDAGHLSSTLITIGVLMCGYAALPRRLGFAYAGSLVISLGTGVLAADAGVTTVEVYTAPLAVLLAGIGVVQWSRNHELSTRITMAPALSAAFGPSMLASLSDEGRARFGLLVAAAIVVLLVGLTRKWQAPVTAGTVVLLFAAVTRGGPILNYVPTWLILALGGAALLTAGVAWEKAVLTGRRATAAYRSLK